MILACLSNLVLACNLCFHCSHVNSRSLCCLVCQYDSHLACSLCCHWPFSSHYLTVWILPGLYHCWSLVSRHLVSRSDSRRACSLCCRWSLVFCSQRRLQARREIRPPGKLLIFLITLPDRLSCTVTDHSFLVALLRSLILTWPVVFDHSFLVAFSGGLIRAWLVVFVHDIWVSCVVAFLALLDFYLVSTWNYLNRKGHLVACNHYIYIGSRTGHAQLSDVRTYQPTVCTEVGTDVSALRCRDKKESLFIIPSKVMFLPGVCQAGMALPGFHSSSLEHHWLLHRFLLSNADLELTTCLPFRLAVTKVTYPFQLTSLIPLDCL